MLPEKRSTDPGAKRGFLDLTQEGTQGQSQSAVQKDHLLKAPELGILRKQEKECPVFVLSFSYMGVLLM